MVSAFVLDASVAAAWLFDDESDPRADAALTALEREGAVVPQLWHLEVRSAVLVAERRGRIRAEESEERLRFLQQLPIRTNTDPDLAAAMKLARALGLSFYDCLYLELARRFGLPLATLDRALARAATAEGLALIAAAKESR